MIDQTTGRLLLLLVLYALGLGVIAAAATALSIPLVWVGWLTDSPERINHFVGFLGGAGSTLLWQRMFHA